MNNFEFHDIEQNTEEWFGMRGGRLTSSKLGQVMANYGKAFGQPAKDYAYNLAVEQITGKPISSTYKNDHMDRGHAEEPIARALYEDEMFCDVINGGFFCSKTVGCSPDGLVSTDGVIEIKSAIASIHYKRVKRQSYDPSYKWQLIGNLKFTGRDWMDFISFCSEYPAGKRLFVYRLWRDQLKEEFAMIDERVKLFLEVVEQSKADILEGSYFNQEKLYTIE